MIALLAFLPNDPREPLTEFADIIKVDIRQVSTAEQATMIKRYGPWRCRLLAEKVETRQEFMETRKEGFVYFQGYFFRRTVYMIAREITYTSRSYLFNHQSNCQLYQSS